MNDNSGKRIIKKYPNRRLYDTAESKYVTLSDVRQLVLDNVQFCVIDKKSGDDITRSILLQIILEQEEGGEPIFSTDVLQQIIGFYGDSVQGMAGDFISNSLQLFNEQQKQLQANLTDAMQHNPMSAAFNEVTRRNVEIWEQMQKTFFSAGGFGQSKKSSDDK